MIRSSLFTHNSLSFSFSAVLFASRIRNWSFVVRRRVGTENFFGRFSDLLIATVIGQKGGKQSEWGLKIRGTLRNRVTSDFSWRILWFVKCWVIWRRPIWEPRQERHLKTLESIANVLSCSSYHSTHLCRSLLTSIPLIVNFQSLNSWRNGKKMSQGSKR
jgi:hypothetical protein